VPYDIAMRMSEARRIAFSVTFGELDGGKWSWDSLAWEEKK
jgi:hypothetical protein